MSIAKIDREKFLAGEWTTVSRLGDWPQVKLTEKLVTAANANYSEDFEVASVNFDHAVKHDGKGPSMAKLKDTRLLGDLVQFRCYDFTEAAKAGILSGEYFRPSIEIYPSHPQLPDKGPYWKGLGLMGNGAAQVRGTPKKFEVAGVEYVGLEDETGGYLCLDAAHWREPVLDPTKPPAPTPPAGPSAEEVARLAAENTAKDTKIASLEAANATLTTNLGALSETVKTMQSHYVQTLRDKSNVETKADLDRLVGDLRLSPGMRDVWYSILTAPDDGIIKMGDGEGSKSFGAGEKNAAILFALSLVDPIMQMGDKMPSPQPIGSHDGPPRDHNQAANLADVETQQAVKEKKILEKDAGAYYTARLSHHTKRIVDRTA